MDGAVASVLVGGLVWESGQWATALPLLFFFVTSSAISKLALGQSRTRESAGSGRCAVQVLSNGAPAALVCGLDLLMGVPQFEVAVLACFACATADTWSSELGTRFGKTAWRISSLKKTQPGVSGAVSIPGSIAGVFGACAIALFALPISGGGAAAAVAIAGTAGFLLDSILGDLFQARYRRHDGTMSDDQGVNTILANGQAWLDNHLVNLISTSAATVGAYLFAAA